MSEDREKSCLPFEHHGCLQRNFELEFVNIPSKLYTNRRERAMRGQDIVKDKKKIYTAFELFK